MVDKNKQIQEGQRAKVLLEDPLLIKSYEVIQNDTFQQWIRTDIEETNKREALKLVNIFLSTKFEGGRHLRRIKKI